MAVFERDSPHTLARSLRKRLTLTERVLWNLLRNRKLEGLKFRRQVPIGPYIVDFACRRIRLVVEIDGPTHVDTEHDKQRELWLEDHGYCVIRFKNIHVWTKGGWVLRQILDAALKLSPTRARCVFDDRN